MTRRPEVTELLLSALFGMGGGRCCFWLVQRGRQRIVFEGIQVAMTAALGVVCLVAIQKAILFGMHESLPPPDFYNGRAPRFVVFWLGAGTPR